MIPPDPASFTDAGMIAAGAAPLPSGSTGVWSALPSLAVARESPSLALGVDPGAPATFYLYALLGRNAGGALASYEYLRIAVDTATGSQTIIGTWTAGQQPAGTARAQAGAFTFVDPASGKTFVYLGGGTADGTTPVALLDAATIAPGGDLGAFAAAGGPIKAFGFGAVSAFGALLALGDQAPSTNILVGAIGTPPTVAPFVSGGALLAPRTLPGAGLVGPIVVTVGGGTGGATPGALRSSEWMVY